MPRHLPVIPASAPDAEPARSPTHWVAVCAGLALALWAPLVLLALALGRTLATRIAGVDDVARLGAVESPTARAAVAAALVVPVLASLALACGGAGAIVGRHGGPREAVLGCTVAALVAWGMSAAGGALSPWPVAVVTGLVVVVTAAISAGVGARLGRRRRRIQA